MNSKTKTLLLDSFVLRLPVYILIWLSYLLLMIRSSPLGISWLPFQQTRVNFSVDHILSNSPFIKYGITSWTDPADLSSKAIYSVQAHEYLHYVFLKSIVGDIAFQEIAPYVDRFVILFLTIVVSEMAIHIFRYKTFIPANLIAVWTSLIFISLPFSYRMLLGMWQDVYCLLFLLLGFLLISKNKIIVGTSVLFYATLWQYHWSFLLGIFYLFIRLCFLFPYTKNNSINLFPPSFRTYKSSLFFVFIFFISPLISLLQKLLLEFNGYTITNSDFLYRVGIDSSTNIHHGGILAALQFLGGNRISLCLPSSLNLHLPNFSILQGNIFLFNCLLSILSMAFISLLSIFGYNLLLRSSKEFLWLLIPLPFAFINFVFIFQQAMAAHLHGHSIFFALFFTLGLVYLFLSLPFVHRSNPLSPVLISIFISAVTFTNIKVSYLTGING